MSSELKDYIAKARSAGKSDEDIMTELIQAGWKVSQVNNAFHNDVPKPSHKLSLSLDQPINAKRVFLTTLVSSLTISAILSIFIFLFGDVGETEARILMTTFSVGGYSLLGLSIAALFEKKGISNLILIGGASILIAFVISMYLIWGSKFWNADESTWRIFGISLTMSVTCAHLALLHVIDIRTKIARNAFVATNTMIWIVAGLLIVVIAGLFDPDTGYFKTLVVAAILDLLGTISTPLLNKIQ